MLKNLVMLSYSRKLFFYNLIYKYFLEETSSRVEKGYNTDAT